MYACMYVCMYVTMCVCMYVYMYVCRHVYINLKQSVASIFSVSEHPPSLAIVDVNVEFLLRVF